MLTLLLVRHGTTIANEKGRWIGREESELSEKGKQEVAALKEKLRAYTWECICASPSKRVIETVQMISDGHSSLQKLQIVEALREIEFGHFEGRDFNWVKNHFPEEAEKMIMQKETYAYPEGESLITFHERVARWLKTFLIEHQKGNYLICAHGGTIRSLLSELLVEDYHLHWHFKIEPASLTVVTITDGYAVIETLNR